MTWARQKNTCIVSHPPLVECGAGGGEGLSLSRHTPGHAVSSRPQRRELRSRQSGRGQRVNSLDLCAPFPAKHSRNAHICNPVALVRAG